MRLLYLLVLILGSCICFHDSERCMFNVHIEEEDAYPYHLESFVAKVTKVAKDFLQYKTAHPQEAISVCIVTDHTNIAVCYSKVILRSFGLDWTEIKTQESLHIEIYENDLWSTMDSTHVPEDLPNLDREGDNRGAGTYYIIPGNMGLGMCEISLVSVRLVLAAVEQIKEKPKAKLVLTGGRIAGMVAESVMMYLVALSRGVPKANIFVDEKGRAVYQKGMEAEKIVLSEKKAGREVREVYVLARTELMDGVITHFRMYAPFKEAKPLPVDVTREEMMNEMERFISLGLDEGNTASRLQMLKLGIAGSGD